MSAIPEQAAPSVPQPKPWSRKCSWEVCEKWDGIVDLERMNYADVQWLKEHVAKHTIISSPRGRVIFRDYMWTVEIRSGRWPFWEWAPICRYFEDAKGRRALAIRGFDEKTKAIAFLNEHLKEKGL